MNSFVSPAGRLVRPVDFGAFLYTPATHHSIAGVVRGFGVGGVSAIAVCLEDAILETDVETAWIRTREILMAMDDVDPHVRPLLFVRPRNIEMAERFAQEECHRFVDGLVAPKMAIDRIERWRRALDGTDLLLMPTLETAEVFDPAWAREMADAIATDLAGRVPMARIGGNDLMSCLGLRRQPGETLYEGPLSWVVSMLVSTLVPRGIRLAAPVFEHFEADEVFAREVAKDIAFGLCGKTVIHPRQIGIVQDAMMVSSTDLASARRILDPVAAAVFKDNGSMSEPATHRAWATDVVDRAERWGVRDQSFLQLVV